ncbi:MAG: hypothetical protein KME29_31425 [Calothrix sp. FI2-JRJ7]|nr:hypothetical protein [Calothrix sp. FI2-JRJ7]
MFDNEHWLGVQRPTTSEDTAHYGCGDYFRGSVCAQRLTASEDTALPYSCGRQFQPT